jgi:hypothetical protein
MVKSKSRYDQRSVNQYVLVSSPCDSRGAPSERISIRHQEIFNVAVGRAACEACSALNLGTNSAFALGPRKTMLELAGHRTFRMQTDF